jgi:hypothetical protein
MVGDKVIQTKNNYDLDVMNGHQGVVLEADPLIVEFDGRAVAVPKDRKGEVELAYCLTPHKCVHPDTLVETAEGLLPIRMVAWSGQIATPEGAADYRNKVHNLELPSLELTTKDGYKVTVTEDHVCEYWDGEKFVTAEARDLPPDAVLRVKLGVTCDPDKPCPLPPVPDGDVRARRYQVPSALDPSLAEFLGLMVADGTLYHDGFRLVKRHQDVADRFAQLGSSLFGAAPRPAPYKNAYGWQFCSTVLSDWLELVGGMCPNRKAVPECVLRSPVDLQAAFLRGLFEDGSVHLRNGKLDCVDWYNVSPVLSQTVRTMLARMGVICGTVEYAGRERLMIYGQNAARFARVVGFVARAKQERLATPCGEETRYWVPVSREEIRDLWQSGLIGKFTAQNARWRGRISRHTAERILQQRPVPWLSDRLAWHYSPLVSSAPVNAQSMCVEVPAVGRFLQNGFPFSNCQGSEFPCAVTVCHSTHSYMLHRNWLYTACTRAQKTAVIIGDERGFARAAQTVKTNERRTLLGIFAKSNGVCQKRRS